MSYEAQVAESRERFVKDTAEHEMTVLLDTGEYRHIRFQKPGTSIYFFDLVTWPGHLTITGDCGTFQFSRTRDMFEFFVPAGKDGFADSRWGINPQYWAEKLQAPKPGDAERYSYEVYRARVQEWLADELEQIEPDPSDELEPEELEPLLAKAAALRAAVADQLLAEYHDAVHSEHAAHELLRDFEHDGIRLYDTWEWSLREYDWQFLWCCWAVVWGIGQYRAGVAAGEPVAA